MLPAHFHDALAAVGLPQDVDLLLRRVSLPFHGSGFLLFAQTNTAFGLISRDHFKSRVALTKWVRSLALSLELPQQ